MDAEKILRELADGEFGDEIRRQMVESILADLAPYGTPPQPDDEWAAYTAEWLRENYL